MTGGNEGKRRDVGKEALTWHRERMLFRGRLIPLLDRCAPLTSRSFVSTSLITSAYFLPQKIPRMRRSGSIKYPYLRKSRYRFQGSSTDFYKGEFEYEDIQTSDFFIPRYRKRNIGLHEWCRKKGIFFKQQLVLKFNYIRPGIYFRDQTRQKQFQ